MKNKRNRLQIISEILRSNSGESGGVIKNADRTTVRNYTSNTIARLKLLKVAKLRYPMEHINIFYHPIINQYQRNLQLTLLFRTAPY